MSSWTPEPDPPRPEVAALLEKLEEGLRAVAELALEGVAPASDAISAKRG